MFSAFAIWYLFLAGAGAGAFMCAAIIDLRTNQTESVKEVPLPAAIGFFAAAILLALSSLLLFIDLGNPEAIVLMFINPFRSVMSMGAWLLLLGIVVSAGISALSILRAPLFRLLQVLEYAGILLSAGVMTYIGVLLSSMASIDFWNTPMLVALFIVSALSCGCALVVLIVFLYDGGGRRMSGIMRASAVLAGLEALLLILFLASRWLYTPAAQQSCVTLFSGSLTGVFCKRVWLLFSSFTITNVYGAPGITSGSTAARTASGSDMWALAGSYAPSAIEFVIVIAVISFCILAIALLAKKLIKPVAA